LFGHSAQFGGLMAAVAILHRIMVP
jgi:hypothetical protein